MADAGPRWAHPPQGPRIISEVPADSPKRRAAVRPKIPSAGRRRVRPGNQNNIRAARFCGLVALPEKSLMIRAGTSGATDCLTWRVMVLIRLFVKGVPLIPNMAKPLALALGEGGFTFIETFSSQGCQIPTVQFRVNLSWPKKARARRHFYGSVEQPIREPHRQS
jgi:hypothetical protein